MSKKVNAVTIIGGEDGPTSIFTIGHKETNILKRFQIWLRRKQYQRKRNKVRKTITAGAHTMEELIAYMQQRYGAVEADGTYPYYEERKRGMKYSLIQREKPELLGEMKRFFPPKDLTDKEALIKWQKELEAWTKECQDRAEAVPYEAFPTEYHMFVIDRGEEGRLEIELDMFRPVISVSYAGRAMEAISEDIHRYYGVTQQDIDEESERYKSLLTVLSTK
ncbi:MAG: hypothetical protein K2I22_14715 [Lachnospiraceae bacterium]|nr:hypothetical protein [Lachnospiraceae bacterium]